MSLRQYREQRCLGASAQTADSDTSVEAGGNSSAPQETGPAEAKHGR
jgi:hypothetical protein